MITVIARNYADLDKMDIILELYEELVAETRAEKGCISYNLYADASANENLVMIEQWESKEDLDNHMNSEHFKRLVPETKKYMTKPVQVSIIEKLL
ncbi:MAG: putative quinol monooxygenase [Anaerovoracaceae bacterium]